MSRSMRWCKLAALVSGGGLMWMWGAGSCVPYNFYADLLGNTIIAGFASAAVATVASGLGLQ